MIKPLLIGGTMVGALYASVLQADPAPATPDLPMQADEAPASAQDQMPVTPQVLIVEMRPASEVSMDDAVSAMPEFVQMPQLRFDTLPPPAQFGPAPVYPRWAPPAHRRWSPPYGGWNNGSRPWGNTWGNRWAPRGGGWNRGYGGGNGWGNSWGDGYGDAAGDADFSFAMRARINADMRGSGYGDGYGYGRGYGHGYEGYPYMPYPPPFAPMPMPAEPEQEPQDQTDGENDISDL